MQDNLLKENTQIMKIDQIAEKLGHNNLTSLQYSEDDGSDSELEYVKQVIAEAKERPSLFSQEEMGHVLAADFLIQATYDTEHGKTELLEERTKGHLSTIDPKLAAALKVVAAIIQNSNSYQSALRAGVLAIQGCIPYVGGIVAAITSVLWPENKKSAWEQVEGQVNKLVENAIFDNEYRIVASQITAIQMSLNQFTNSPSEREKGTILIAVMVLVNSLYERVNQSKYRHMLIGLMVPIGALHLTVLSERYNHYKALFENDDRTQALEDLKRTYKNYKVFFETVYPEWKKWRNDKLEVYFKSNRVLWNVVYNYGVNDHLGQYNFNYSLNDKSRATEFKEWVSNKCNGDMAEVLCGTHSYSSFFKDIDVTLSPILSELDTIVLGPYQWTRLQNTGNMGVSITGKWSNDKPKGEVKKIKINAHNIIEGLQFFYPDMDGTKITNASGNEFELTLEGKHCIGAQLDYSSGIVYKIKFLFEDGSSSEYGNKGNWRSIAFIDATVGGGYKLASANFAAGMGPGSVKGINGVQFTFKRA